MAEKMQKVCITTNVVSQINNSIKIVDRVYLVKPAEKEPEQTYSKPMNFEGWTCVSVVKDQHKITNVDKAHVEDEYEVWVNNKNLDINSTLLKGTTQKSLENNVDQDPDGRYQIVINYTDCPMTWDWDQNDSKEAEMTFAYISDRYLEDLEYDDFLIKCEDFEEDIQYNEDGSLKYAYAKDHEGNIIFGIYDSQNN